VERTNQDPLFTSSSEGREVIDLLDRGAITAATTAAANAGEMESASVGAVMAPKTSTSTQSVEDEWSRSEEALRVVSEALSRERIERTLMAEAVHEAYEEYKLGNLQEFYGSTIGVRDDEIVPRGLAMYCRNDDVQRCDWLNPDSHSGTLDMPTEDSPHGTGAPAGAQELYERRGGTRRLGTAQRASRHPKFGRGVERAGHGWENDYKYVSGSTSNMGEDLRGGDHYRDSTGMGGGRARGEVRHDMNVRRSDNNTAAQGRRRLNSNGGVASQHIHSVEFQFAYQHYTSRQMSPADTPSAAYSYYASPEVEEERLLTATTGRSGRSIDPHLGSSRGGDRVRSHLERFGDTHPERYSTLNSASGAAQCPEQNQYGHDCKAQFPTIVDCHPVSKIDGNGLDIGEAGSRPQWECSHKRHSNYCGQWDCDTLATEQMKLYELEISEREHDIDNKKEAQKEYLRLTRQVTHTRQETKATREQLRHEQVELERQEDEKRQRDEEELRRINSWKLQGDMVNRSATTANPGDGFAPGYGKIDKQTGEPVLLRWADQGNGMAGERPEATEWGSFENRNQQLP
jgi:hypothetical protein